ncbi:MAG TPA: GntR family transcriptional regulator [Chthoniobacteraceae bacterium]|nr:GntR family transcriptional regulator [Chthoniobacteraceae bacterium]
MNPIYVQIAEQLEAQRLTLSVPLALADERTLAQQFSVSRETIRSALRHLEERGAVTRKRRIGTFLQPRRMQVDRLQGKSIAVVPPWWAKPGSWYASMIFEGVTRWASENDCKFVLLHVGPRPAHEHDWVERARRMDLSGVLWIQPQEKQLSLLKKVSRFLPTVALGRTLLSEGLHNVIPDYGQAAELIDTHLAGHHCTTYAVVEKNVFDPYTSQWIKSIADAQAKRGMDFDPSYHYFDFQCFQSDQSLRLAELLLDFYLPARSEIQGLVFPSSGVLSILAADPRFRERMLDGLSVVTTNYGPYPMETLLPGHTITHVACDWISIASRAMDILAQVAEGHQVPEVTREPVELVAGDTVHLAAGRGTLPAA